MSPRYHGNGGCRAAYECTQARKQDGNMGVCWSVAGAAIDKAVAVVLLPKPVLLGFDGSLVLKNL